MSWYCVHLSKITIVGGRCWPSCLSWLMLETRGLKQETRKLSLFHNKGSFYCYSSFDNRVMSLQFSRGVCLTGSTFKVILSTTILSVREKSLRWGTIPYFNSSVGTEGGHKYSCVPLMSISIQLSLIEKYPPCATPHTSSLCSVNIRVVSSEPVWMASVPVIVGCDLETYRLWFSPMAELPLFLQLCLGTSVQCVVNGHIGHL